MGQPVYTPDGQLVTVDEADAAQGFREGRYRLARGPVRVRLRDGTIGTVDDSEAQRVLDSGGTFATQEEFDAAAEAEKYGNSLGQQSIAGLEGFGRGVSIGGTDVVGRIIGGEEYATDARLRREYNPVTSVGGEILGSVAPLLIPGAGEANVARIAGEGAVAATEAARLARAGGAAADLGRTVAAPGRAVQAFGEAAARAGGRGATALGMGAESGVMGRMGARALEAAAQGAAEGAVYGVGQSVSEVALGETPEIRADRLLLNIGGGALLGAGMSGVLAAGGSLARSAMRAMPDLGTSSSARLIADRSRLEASGLYGKDTLNRIEARFGGVGPDGRAVRDGTAKFARDLDELGVGTGLREAGEGGIAGRTNLPTPAQSDIDARTLVERAGRQFDEVGSAVEASGQRVDLQNVIAKARQLAAEARLAPSGGDDVARRIEALIGRADDERSIASLADSGLSWAEAQKQKTLWANMVTEWTGAVKSTEPSAQLRALGSALNGEMRSAATRAGVVDAWEAANRAYGVGKMVLTKGGRKSEMGGIGGAVNTGSITSDLFSGTLAGAGAALGGLPLAVFGAVGGRIATQEVRRFTPAVKARAMQWLMRANTATGKAMKDAAVGAIASNVARAARSAVPRVTVEAYNAAVRESRDLTPESLTRRLGQNTAALASIAPETHQAVINRGLAAAASIEAAIPQGDRMRPNEMQPHLRRSSPVSESERARFMAHKAAVENPQIILDAIRDQTLTPDQAQVLHDVYPAMYEEMQREIMRQVSSMEAPLPYQARLRLGVLLNAATDPSLAPDVVQVLQMGYSAAVSTTQGPPPPNKPGRSSMSGQFTASEVDNFERRRAAPVG